METATDVPTGRYPEWVQGHRGAKAVAPENTIDGFECTIEHGVPSVELDVRLSADGVLVCVHDETLLAYGGPDRSVREMTAVDITAVELTGGTRVPTLEAVLDLAVGTLGLNIEVKNDPREASFDSARAAAVAVATLLDARAAEGTDDDIVAVSSFDADSVATFLDRTEGPGGVAALLTPPARSTRRVLADADALGVTAVHPHHSSLQSARSVGRMLDHGLVVRTWTVNSRRLAERLLRYGVSTIVTDDPRRIANPAPADR